MMSHHDVFFLMIPSCNGVHLFFDLPFLSWIRISRPYDLHTLF